MLFCCAGVSGEDIQELVLWQHNIHILSHVSLTTATSFSLSLLCTLASACPSLTEPYWSPRLCLHSTQSPAQPCGLLPPLQIQFFCFEKIASRFWQEATNTSLWSLKEFHWRGKMQTWVLGDYGGRWRGRRTFGVWHFCICTFGFGGNVSAVSLIWIQIKWNKMGDNHCWSNSDLNSDTEIACEL